MFFLSESKTWSRLSNHHKTQEKEEIQKCYIDIGRHLIPYLVALMIQQTNQLTFQATPKLVETLAEVESS